MAAREYALVALNKDRKTELSLVPHARIRTGHQSHVAISSTHRLPTGTSKPTEGPTRGGSLNLVASFAGLWLSASKFERVTPN